MRLLAAFGWLIVVIGAVVAFFSFANWHTRRQHARFSREDVEVVLEKLVSPGFAYDDDWELFLNWPIDDPYLESIRHRCLDIDGECTGTNERITQEGIKRVRAILQELRGRT